MRQWIERILVLCAVLLATGLPADAARVKDIADIYGVRDNNLLGYGLVTGFRELVIRCEIKPLSKLWQNVCRGLV